MPDLEMLPRDDITFWVGFEGNEHTLSLGPLPPTPVAEFGYVQFDAPAHSFVVGTLLDGATYANPLPQNSGLPLTSDASGSEVGVAISTMTTEPEEPESGYSAWLFFRLGNSGRIIVTSSNAASEVSLWQGASLDVAVNLTESASAELDTEGLAEGDYYVRVYQLASSPSPITINWQYLASLDEYQHVLTVDEDVLAVTPGSVEVSLVNLPPGQEVTFTVGGLASPTVLEADDTGRILRGSVDVPELDAGVWTIVATAGSFQAAGTVTVLEDAPPALTPQAPDAQPVNPGAGTRWVLQDLQPGGLGSYVFPVNPSRWSEPHTTNRITVDRTTSPIGQPIVWMGGNAGEEFVFAGNARTATFVQRLRDYHAINRRFYLIDHRNRAWIVTFDDLDLRPVRDRDFPNAHTYEVKAYCYAGPLEVT